MPDTNTYWRTDRPEEGFYTTLLPNHPERPVRTFLPTDYQPRYPYPLVVAFHAAGGSEESGARLLPRISRRNYIGLGLRRPRRPARLPPRGRRADAADVPRPLRASVPPRRRRRGRGRVPRRPQD